MSALSNMIDLSGPLATGAGIGMGMRRLAMAEQQAALAREDAQLERAFRLRQYDDATKYRDRAYESDQAERLADSDYANALIGSIAVPQALGPTPLQSTADAASVSPTTTNPRMSPGMVQSVAAHARQTLDRQRDSAQHIKRRDGLLATVRARDPELAAALENPMLREEALAASPLAKNAARWLPILSAGDAAFSGMFEDSIQRTLEQDRQSRAQAIKDEELSTLNTLMRPLTGAPEGQMLPEPVLRALAPEWMRGKLDEIRRPSKVKALRTQYPELFPTDEAAGAHIDLEAAGMAGKLNPAQGEVEKRLALNQQRLATQSALTELRKMRGDDFERAKGIRGTVPDAEKKRINELYEPLIKAAYEDLAMVSRMTLGGGNAGPVPPLGTVRPQPVATPGAAATNAPTDRRAKLVEAAKKIRAEHPDWTPEQVKAELAKIKE